MADRIDMLASALVAELIHIAVPAEAFRGRERFRTQAFRNLLPHAEIREVGHWAMSVFAVVIGQEYEKNVGRLTRK